MAKMAMLSLRGIQVHGHFDSLYIGSFAYHLGIVSKHVSKELHFNGRVVDHEEELMTNPFVTTFGPVLYLIGKGMTVRKFHIDRSHEEHRPSGLVTSAPSCIVFENMFTAL